jgi:hypothetical protein
VSDMMVVVVSAENDTDFGLWVFFTHLMVFVV